MGDVRETRLHVFPKKAAGRQAGEPRAKLPQSLSVPPNEREENVAPRNESLRRRIKIQCARTGVIMKHDFLAISNNDFAAAAAC